MCSAVSVKECRLGQALSFPASQRQIQVLDSYTFTLCPPPLAVREKNLLTWKKLITKKNWNKMKQNKTKDNRIKWSGSWQSRTTECRGGPNTTGKFSCWSPIMSFLHSRKTQKMLGGWRGGSVVVGPCGSCFHARCLTVAWNLASGDHMSPSGLLEHLHSHMHVHMHKCVRTHTHAHACTHMHNWKKTKNFKRRNFVFAVNGFIP